MHYIKMTKRRPKKVAKREAKEKKKKPKLLRAVLPAPTRYYRTRLTCHLLKTLPGPVLPRLAAPVLPPDAGAVLPRQLPGLLPDLPGASCVLGFHPGSGPGTGPVLPHTRYYRAEAGTTAAGGSARWKGSLAL